jgi:hypothetical protein
MLGTVFTVALLPHSVPQAQTLTKTAFSYLAQIPFDFQLSIAKRILTLGSRI